MPYENVLYEVDGPLALITINRPERHNAISLTTLDDLHATIAEAAGDEAVRAIAITGAGGKAFASGSDLGEVEHRNLAVALTPLVQGVAERLERTPKATIAAINGYCMGGGLEVALGCDVRIATPQSKFATPEGRIGIIPGWGRHAAPAPPHRARLGYGDAPDGRNHRRCARARGQPHHPACRA